ncbi:YdcF family protein [Granulicella arctica]|uniref:YdcF family protein n=1 Tax=Granulicella arctica TaxID=940613 RepID=UPI0021E011F5|nr:YdcF family protein [Granulicella arctica]
MNITTDTKPRSSLHLVRKFVGILLLLALIWTVWVYHQIATVASVDQAQTADAIAVFGAAQYSGRPSPVFHARLDHVVDLYHKQVAPLIITLGGGSDKDSGMTEGGVGRDYLLANGIPLDKIIAETASIDTQQQVDRLVEIARENNLHHVVVVSDGTHLFRIRVLCEEAGLEVYTSPRSAFGRISNYNLAQRYLHEILSYTVFKLNIDSDALHHWLEDKPE